MPNRILKESICTSEDVAAMGWFVEVFYYRLLVNCDDYGRMDGRAAILRARLFPLCAQVGEEEVRGALARLVALGCVGCYEAQGRAYLQVLAWGEHQRLRNSRQKYPPPAADGRELPPESETETQSESQSETETETDTDTEGGGRAGDAMEEVAAAVAAVGMPYERRDREIARELAEDFTTEWVAQAVKRAADGPSRTWRYVRGILKRWRERGAMDAAGSGTGAGTGTRGAGKQVLAQQYTQRTYTAEELEGLFEVL